MPVRAGHPRVVIAGAIVGVVALGKQDQGSPIHRVPLRNAERRRGAPTQEGDVVNPFKGPGDGVADTDLDRLRKECVRVDTGIGGGPTDDHRPLGWRRMSRCRRREERAEQIRRPSHGTDPPLLSELNQAYDGQGRDHRYDAAARCGRARTWYSREFHLAWLDRNQSDAKTTEVPCMGERDARQDAARTSRPARGSGKPRAVSGVGREFVRNGRRYRGGWRHEASHTSAPTARGRGARTGSAFRFARTARTAPASCKAARPQRRSRQAPPSPAPRSRHRALGPRCPSPGLPAPVGARRGLRDRSARARPPRVFAPRAGEPPGASVVPGSAPYCLPLGDSRAPCESQALAAGEPSLSYVGGSRPTVRMVANGAADYAPNQRRTRSPRS